MWEQITRYLPEFPSAVLSGLDPAGYPYSLRCRPLLDAERRILRLGLPPGALLQAGPACLLCHSHDEHLWNLKSFALRGALERQADGWAFVPRQFIPGMGIGGWRSYIDFVRHGRAATRDFFAARGQPVPRVAWDELLALVGA